MKININHQWHDFYCSTIFNISQRGKKEFNILTYHYQWERERKQLCNELSYYISIYPSMLGSSHPLVSYRIPLYFNHLAGSLSLSLHFI